MLKSHFCSSMFLKLNKGPKRDACFGSWEKIQMPNKSLANPVFLKLQFVCNFALYPMLHVSTFTRLDISNFSAYHGLFLSATSSLQNAIVEILRLY
jgi:hypothetical protein